MPYLQLDDVPQFWVRFQSQHDALVIVLNHELLTKPDEPNLPLLLKALQHRVMLFHHIEVMLRIEDMKL